MSLASDRFLLLMAMCLENEPMRKEKWRPGRDDFGYRYGMKWRPGGDDFGYRYGMDGT